MERNKQMGIKMLFIGSQDKVVFCSKPRMTFMKFDITENYFDAIECCCTVFSRKPCPVVIDFIQRLKLKTRAR